MPRRGRLSTKRCSYIQNVSGVTFFFRASRVAITAAFASRVTIVAICSLVSVAGAAAQPRTATFERGLDAYFGEQPARAVTLLGDTMARADSRQFREPTLYVLGKSFAQLHLYEKAEDQLRAVLAEFPRGRFAPLALRELARIFFDLREYGALINVEQTYRNTLTASSYPAEFWYLVGQSNYLLGRKNEAREPLFRVAPGTDWYPYARFTMAQVEFASGRADRALGYLNEVTAEGSAPPLLRERALRVAGMILYEQRRYADSVKAYQGIAESSVLFGPTRLDLALAAEAIGDTEAVGEALSDAAESASDDFVRAEAQVAFGRLFNRARQGSKARTLFEKAMVDLREREGRLRSDVSSESQFRAAFDELVTFARQNRAALRRQRLNEDLQVMRDAGVASGRSNLASAEKVSPKTYLFAFLHRHFHNPVLIEVFVELTVEIEDFRKEVETMANALRSQSAAFSSSPAIPASRVPADLSDRLRSLVFLVLADFDLTSRFYDALAVSEQMEASAAIQEKQKALARTTESLRVILLGSRELPSRQAMLSSLDRAAKLISAGELRGLASTKIREGFLQELRSDHDSISYVLDNLQLKERQMTGALRGVGLRARNLNLPVLTTMTEWLTALQQLETKYKYIEVDRDKRPWHLSGHGGDLDGMLARSTQNLDTLRGRAVVVLRETARQLVDKEQARHSLVVAQAEEGIADALFEERSGR